MCIIIYKPFGKDVPDEERLRYCWDRNPDGGGFAVYMDDGKWYAQKGFMKWKKFIKAWRDVGVGKDNTAVVHFRIRSAGKISPGNCHPFPLTDNYKEMKAKAFASEQIIFHNGTCGLADGDASDTMAFIKNTISVLMPYTQDPKIKGLMDRLIKATHDRWFITKGSVISRYGTWVEDNGCFYSNSYFKPYVPAVPATTVRGVGSAADSAWNLYDDEYEKWWLKADATLSNSTTAGGGGTIRTHTFGKKVLFSREGTVFKNDTEVYWDDKVEQDAPAEENDKVIMCPNCFEDKYLEDSPFVGQGDTICMRCGCCFDEGTDVTYVYDEEMRQAYNKRLEERKNAQLSK